MHAVAVVHQLIKLRCPRARSPRCHES